MPTACREYVCSVIHGDYEACIAARDAAVADIRRLNEDRRRANYDARVISNVEQLEDEAIEIDKAVAVTAGSLPLLWVNITFDPAQLGLETIGELEKRHGLVLIAQANSRVSYF